MAKYRLDSINYVSVGKTEKLFNVDISYNEEDNELCPDHDTSEEKTDEKREKIQLNKVFVADIDDDSVMGTGESNKFSIETVGSANQVRIHPVYDINDICIKSSIKKIKNSSSEYKNKSEDYVDIYVPSLQNGILDFCQMDNYAYCISERTTKGPTMLQTDLYEQTQDETANEVDDSSYHWKLKSSDLKTFIYNVSSDMTTEEAEVLSNHYKPKYNLDGFKYNYFIEIPQNLPTGTYNDYEAGDIQGDIFQGKNAYDSHYGMNMPALSVLKNTRDYVGLANCGDTVFLKYFDNIDYEIPLRRREKEDVETVQNISVTEKKQSKYPFQKIETLDSINRFRSNIRHKSQLYSIKISNSGVNFIEDEKKKENIKKDIKNNIREITKRICPATTQLFDVFFDS